MGRLIAFGVTNAIILVFTTIALLVLAAPASAEFTSQIKTTQGKASQGKTSFVQLAIDAGGGTISCAALPESSSPTTWRIENAKGASSKGSRFELKVEKWGECVAESSQLKTKATVSQCELETKETGTQIKILGTVVSTCTAKIAVEKATCEIVIEPTGNKELSAIELTYSGQASYNTMLTFAMGNLTTKVNEVCKKIGINSSNEGELVGITEAELVTFEAPAPKFVAGAVPRRLSLTTKGTVTITNGGKGLGQPTDLKIVEEKGDGKDKNMNWFELKDPMTCGVKFYNPGDACPIDVTFKKPSNNGSSVRVLFTVESPGGTVPSKTAIFGL